MLIKNRNYYKDNNFIWICDFPYIITCAVNSSDWGRVKIGDNNVTDKFYDCILEKCNQTASFVLDSKGWKRV